MLSARKKRSPSLGSRAKRIRTLRGERQHERCHTRDVVRRRKNGRFLDDYVRIRTANAKRTHAGDPACGTTFPRTQRIGDTQRTAVKGDVWIEPGKMNLSRNLLMLHHERRLD